MLIGRTKARLHLALMAGATVFLRRSSSRRLGHFEAQRAVQGAERMADLKASFPPGPKHEELLPPMPVSLQNCIAQLDTGPFANPAPLQDHAFYLPGLNGPADDRAVFNRLMDELDFRSCWLNTGMKFSRDICLGDDEVLDRAPTYRAIVERVANHFGVKVVRTLVNLYRDGSDWCNLHSDQYHQGGYPIDLTVGSTFGDTRRLIWVEKDNEDHKIEIPQRNGDVFAFSDRINSTWRHMVPREGPEVGPRISVIVWCSRGKAPDFGSQGSSQRLGSFPHMLYFNPKADGSDFQAGPVGGKGGKAAGKGAPVAKGSGRLPAAAHQRSSGKGALTASRATLPGMPAGQMQEAAASKALTLQGAQQVFAILRGIKLIENRTFRIPVGWHAIHVGAQFINDERAERTRLAWPDAPKEDELPHGVIAGLFYVQEHRKPEDCRPGYIWARGPVCNVISRAIELPRPLRARGSQGLWDLSDSQKADIQQQLADGAVLRHFNVETAVS